MKRIFAVTALALSLAACATSGTKVSTQQVQSLQNGKTTIAEAEQMLGKPNEVDHNNDGTTSLKYIYSEAHANAASYIPLFGAFVGHTDIKTQTTTLNFDTHGLYTGYQSGAGQQRAGLFSGS